MMHTVIFARNSPKVQSVNRFLPMPFKFSDPKKNFEVSQKFPLNFLRLSKEDLLKKDFFY